MQRDIAYLLDIMEAAKLVLDYVKGKTRVEFFDDLQCQDAVIRRLEIIGEAANRISEETRIASPHLPWNNMIGMRNVMIHNYDDVDMAIVWETVEKDLPALISAVEKLIPSEDEA